LPHLSSTYVKYLKIDTCLFLCWSLRAFSLISSLSALDKKK
jgi:hypothetical protein